MDWDQMEHYETWERVQRVFPFYWDWNVRVDAWGRRPYGLTHEFWA